ncbi:hypothetical protein NQ318_004759 [Aromia moschata]|uniref:Cathepsin L n=1 Tax=Aromia moschata TaxID=1265417 RepID=A0AAV8XYE1_9CUCU|nr:hypothetical protein NQ318_004759 [Aromia moschata]
MKFLIVLASVVLAISAATDEELWSEFKKNHGREYRNLREEQVRFSIFQQKLRKIETHNARYDKGEETYYLGINQFSDLTQEEFKARLNYASKPNIPYSKVHKASGVKAASEVNWVSQGAVVGVKDQGNCGSCWAFSTTGSLEGQYAIKYGSQVSLSEQNLMDCSTDYGNAACDGGWMIAGFSYVKDQGIETESDYPYTAQSGTSCSFSSSLSVLTISDWTVVNSGDEYSLQDAVANHGPISVAINADYFDDYAGGVYNGECSQEMDHGVLAVGYGTENGLDYWLIKNSWGAEWGESGYLKLARNQNLCGVANDASWPTIN